MTEGQSFPRSGFSIFVVGALIGAGVALLFAPQSGTETRKLLTKKAKQLRGKVENTFASAQSSIKNRTADPAATVGDGKNVAHTTRTNERAHR